MRDEVTNHDFIKRTQKIQSILNSYEATLTKGEMIMVELKKKDQSEQGLTLTQQDFTRPPRPGRS